jgi:sortase A
MRRLLGVVLVAAGCLGLAWLLLTPAVSAHRTAQAQAELAQQVPTRAAAPDRAGVPTARAVGRGDALATVSVPRLGRQWRWVAVEGTGEEELARGPGHYAGTALPGERGNVGIAAHRAGHGDPFIDFDQLRPGDTVLIEQGGVSWTYVLDTTPRIVLPSDTWVLDPGAGRRLTLTTCWPRYGSSKRMYVSGALTEVDRLRDGRSQQVWTASGRPRTKAAA